MNRKQIASTNSPDRNQQFLYIGQQRERFASQGQPIISVDTKKKEVIGNFKNTGGLAIPYGIYDTRPTGALCS